MSVYRHFKSKGDLYAAAVSRAFEEMAGHVVAVAETASKGQELRAIIEDYLSPEHANHPETACPLALMAGEFARQPAEIRKRVNQSMVAVGSECFPTSPATLSKRSEAASLFCFPEWRASWSPPVRLRTRNVVS